MLDKSFLNDNFNMSIDANILRNLQFGFSIKIISGIVTCTTNRIYRFK